SDPSGVSPASTLPPGNSQEAASFSPGDRRASKTQSSLGMIAAVANRSKRAMQLFTDKKGGLKEEITRTSSRLVLFELVNAEEIGLLQSASNYLRSLSKRQAQSIEKTQGRERGIER